MHGRKEHGPNRAQGDHHQHHIARETEKSDDDRHEGRDRYRPDHLERRPEIVARLARAADERAQDDAGKGGKHPTIDHSAQRRERDLGDRAGGKAALQRIPGLVGPRQEDGRDAAVIGDELPKPDEQRSDGNAAEIPERALEPAHRAAAASPARPKSRRCANSSAQFKPPPITPIHSSMANMRSGWSDCDAFISSKPTPSGLMVISTVTAMMSETAAERRKPTK